MANTTNFVLPGAYQNDASDDSALYLEMFSGEVLSFFNEMNVMRPLLRSMSVGAGKSFQFPRIGKAEAVYHQRGENILEGSNYLEQIESTSLTINVDKILLASCFVDDWDEAVKHFETRSEYARQLAAGLSRTTDTQLLRMVAKAASEASPFAGTLNTDASTGSVVQLSASGGDTILDSIVEAAEALCEKDVPMEDVTVVLSPKDFYALQRLDELASADFSAAGNSDRAAGTVFKAYGFRVAMSNRLTGGLGDQAAPVTGEINDYTGNFSDVRALAFSADAVGSVIRKDVEIQNEYKIERQGTVLVARQQVGHGLLKQECAVKIVDVA